ncbi:TIGR01841 family phasin [Chromobacterium alticapitis]|nr:TIGR01841 family phasin [Chromobacterium alticapitis]
MSKILESNSSSDNATNTILKLFQASLNATERLAKLQVKMSKEVIDYHAAVINEFSSSPNSHDSFSKIGELSSDAVNKVFSHSKDVYDIFSESQNEMSKLLGKASSPMMHD